MMGSFDIYFLDPNFVTWSNVYLSCLVSVQPRPGLERSDPEPPEMTGSHGKGRNVFLPSNGYTQSSVVYLEVESCFYLVISVSFSTGG